MKILKLTDMAWCVVDKRESVIAVLKNANIVVPENTNDEELLSIVKDNVSNESINYGIWKIAKTNPFIRNCHNCAHLLDEN